MLNTIKFSPIGRFQNLCGIWIERGLILRHSTPNEVGTYFYIAHSKFQMNHLLYASKSFTVASIRFKAAQGLKALVLMCQELVFLVVNAMHLSSPSTICRLDSRNRLTMERADRFTNHAVWHQTCCFAGIDDELAISASDDPQVVYLVATV